jgi:UDP-GlcNAc:undecaprenyl-phosphate/decaprenyl-phosphate GlcNAc-1-phosphate transferase
MTLSELIFLFLSIFINFLIFINFDLLIKFIPFFDKPNLSRKTHKLPVPVLGGAWILFNVFIIILYATFFNENLLLKSHFSNLRDKLHFLFFLTLFMFIGLYDDVNDIKYKQKLFIFLFFSFCFFFTNEKLIIYNLKIIFIDNLYSFHLGKYSLFFAAFSLFFLLISLNFIDGINLNLGLFYLINILYLLFLTKNIFLLYLIIPILFFLYLNYHSRVFLGDSGAYVIALIFTYFFINYYNQGHINFDTIFFIFLYPIVDLLRVVIARLVTFKNIAVGDRNHFHHILENKYGNYRAILIIVLKNLLLIFSSSFIPPLFIVILYIIVYFCIIFICKKKISNV